MPPILRTCRSVSTLNLGILAHVDAGKTSLTERLLHAAGVIDEVGSVDAGSTQTDSLALERQRGIAGKLTAAIVPMGRSTGLGTRQAAFVPYDANDADFTTCMVDRLAEHDD